MNYERGKNKELDDATDALREYLPGFYPGCTLELTDTFPSWHKRNIGKRFIATTFASDILRVADRFKLVNGFAYFIDPNNTYGINYEKHHLKVVDPMYWDAPDSIKDPNEMTSKELEEELKQYFPGFYIGCTMEITDQCIYKQDVGKRFVTADVHNRLKNTVNDIRKGVSFILDPNNTYMINYRNPSWLKVVDPEVIESAPKKELVFGKYHIGQVVVSLVDFSCLRKKNQLFRVLPNSDYDHLYYHNDRRSGYADSWRAATVEETEYYQRMIAQGHKEIILDTPKIDVPCGVDPFPVQDVSYDLNIPGSSGSEVTVKEKQKTNLISDFITTQLKSKQKRVKLSIK